MRCCACADVKTAPVERLGPSIERHPHFPNRANVGFMQIVDRNHILLRVFERGAGETQACGTGACAAVAVGRAARIARRAKCGSICRAARRWFLGQGPGQHDLADGTGHDGFYRFDRLNAIHGSQTMTTSHARGIKQDVLNDNAVADYLQTYPDFFERNSQLLDQVAPAACTRRGGHGELGGAPGRGAARAQSVARTQAERAGGCGARQRCAGGSNPSPQPAADPRAHLG